MTWNLFKKRRPCKRSRNSRSGSRFRPRVEALETREMLAASPIVFTIAPASSSLALTGSLGTNQLQQQGAGSLTTAYTGTLGVVWDPAASTLGFQPNTATPGSLASAGISGSWRPVPGGADNDPFPANYGGLIEGTIMGVNARAWIAVRNFAATISTATPLTLAGGGPTFTFPSTQTLTLVTGEGDYHVRTPPIPIIAPDGIFVTSGTEPLAGETGMNQSTTAGSLQDLGNGSYRLTVPIRFTYSDTVEGQALTLIVTGQFVGNAILPVVDLNGDASGSDFTATFNAGGPAVPLAAADATVTRMPTQNLVSATITLTNRPDGAAETLDAVVTGTSLTKSYNPATGQLTITGSAPPSVYEQILRTVTYANSFAATDDADRIVHFTVSDGTNSSLIRVTTIDVVPRPLTLRSFTPTATGFIAVFNQAFNAGELNLYDGAGTPAPLGPADVTLVGQSGGAVSGSLVIQPGNKTATFVSTTGVLGEDSYTATFRSASNGFKDAMGGLLDGNGDGTTGDNATRMFAVSAADAAARVVSLPSIARGPGQAVNVPAATTTAGLPLRLSDGLDVTSVTVDITFDPALLSITEVTALPPGSNPATLTPLGPGQVRISFTFPSPGLPAGPVDFVKLTAAVPLPAQNRYAQKHVLNLSNLSVNSGAIAARDDDGVHVVAYLGDTTANAAYSATDPTRIARVVAGFDTGFANYRLADPMVIADITGNGSLSGLDATRVLQELLGFDRSEIADIPPGVPPIVIPGPDPFLRFPKDFQAQRGGTVTVPLLLDMSDGLESADLAISYDAQRLEVIAVVRGSLTLDFDTLGMNHNKESGTLRVALGRSEGPISGRGEGSVLLIDFRVRDDAPRGPAIINLHQNVEETITALNEGGLDLIPDPSNEAGDILDGQILIEDEPSLQITDKLDVNNTLIWLLIGEATATAFPEVDNQPLTGDPVDQVFSNDVVSERPGIILDVDSGSDAINPDLVQALGDLKLLLEGSNLEWLIRQA